VWLYANPEKKEPHFEVTPPHFSTSVLTLRFVWRNLSDCNHHYFTTLTQAK
jgi:hypothetical protein